MLSSFSLRCKTGIWLMPQGKVGDEENEAARLGLDAVDIRRVLLENLPEETSYADLSSERVQNLLHQIANRQQGSHCLLIYNLDLLLARLTMDERDAVWRYLKDALPHAKHALLIALPASAGQALLGDEHYRSWHKEDRLSAD
jgi:hypothetical protein